MEPSMNELRRESWSAIVAFAISLGYMLNPSPYWMGAFMLVVQPLFFVATAGYTAKVFRERERRKILEMAPAQVRERVVVSK
jgi:hypothetical protein